MASSRFVLGVMASFGFHVLAFVQMNHAKASMRAAPPPVVIEVDMSTPPTPPPEPPVVAPTQDELPAPRQAAASPRPTIAPVAPPAQAGKILAAAEDAQPAVADFTMVQGTGAT